MTFGIMGAEGSFSEEAARTYAMKASIQAPELAYLVTAEAVLTALDISYREQQRRHRHRSGICHGETPLRHQEDLRDRDPP